MKIEIKLLIIKSLHQGKTDGGCARPKRCNKRRIIIIIRAWKNIYSEMPKYLKIFEYLKQKILKSDHSHCVVLCFHTSRAQSENSFN